MFSRERPPGDSRIAADDAAVNASIVPGRVRLIIVLGRDCLADTHDDEGYIEAADG